MCALFHGVPGGKHGLINPNVFKDLISHSRPKLNQGRVSGLRGSDQQGPLHIGVFGFTQLHRHRGKFDDEDCGQHTNPSVDVPGGGQKGVITMFPKTRWQWGR